MRIRTAVNAIILVEYGKGLRQECAYALAESLGATLVALTCDKDVQPDFDMLKHNLDAIAIEIAEVASHVYVQVKAEYLARKREADGVRNPEEIN